MCIVAGIITVNRLRARHGVATTETVAAVNDRAPALAGVPLLSEATGLESLLLTSRAAVDQCFCVVLGIVLLKLLL